MYDRIIKVPRQSFFLFGPRGTGKSTWLKQQFPRAHFINLLMEREYQRYLLNPEDFYNEVRAIKAHTWIVVDEVQRLPQLLNYVHELMEQKKWRFVLTGSSARQLKRSGVNLLAGRAITKAMFPFVPEELGADFDLNHSMRFGCLPVVQDAVDSEETLSAYVETYLRQEVKEEALVKNLSGFSRFLRVAALMHGQVLNIANVAREGEVARSTVNGYFEILEDTLIGHRLDAYSPRLKLRETKHPKFYLFDSGVVRTLRNQRGAVLDHERGPLLEGFVLHLLRSYQSYSKVVDQIYYWRPTEASQYEVDFLLKKQSEFVAIEVKATQRVRPDDLKGLRAINELSGLKRKILVYLGRTSQKLADGIEVMPVQSFISWLAGIAKSGKL